MSELSEWGQRLTEQYPDPSLWPAYNVSWKRDVYRFVRPWITEGIPFAFREKPMVFELAREKVANRLSVSPKSVAVTGSGSTGYSYSLGKFGAGYESGRSDIDLFVVSEERFDRTVADFELFVARFTAGLELPQTPAEARFWPANVAETPNNVRRGFIDQRRIPVR